MASDILKAIAESTDCDTQLTLGYTNKKGIRLQPFADFHDARYHILKAERKLRIVRDRKRMGYIWGRYDFIIIRKDLAHDLLKFYEEKISSSTLLGVRLRIFWKNLFGRSSTTQLYVQ